MNRRNVVFVLALSVVMLAASLAHAQKNINFATGGTIAATLLFGNVIHPDSYVFRAEAGDSFQIDVTSSQFDATLRVVGPDAAIVLFNDDAVGFDPSLFFTASDSGYYLVIVSSFSGNAPGGDYLLTMSAFRNLSTQGTGEGDSAEGGSNETEAK
ncbi:PPC domain-containing protein [Candidatus Entotheonella palauensis]|uniref:PPC domain-containing protein n=1 Tax=Candidatus Entotheonella palauensis TaxID=93172 RepID=UPI001178B4E0|nr:PPC domain-containing protein [Candidatus Entotheonella palauensis]